MKNNKKEYRITAKLTKEQKQTVEEWKEKNPHIKLQGEFARLVMAYVTGRIPRWRMERGATSVHAGVDDE